MILSKESEDIFKIWGGFYECYISGIKWNNTLEDLLISVNYFWDEPKGYKEKDIILNFKKCTKVAFNFANAQLYGKN